KLDQLFDPRAVRHLFLLCETPIDKGRQHPGLHPHVAAQHYVVEHRHAAEERDVLERTRDAECRDLRWSGAGYVVTLKDDRARVRPIEPADHVEERGLARTIRPNDRHQLAAADGERYALDGAHPAEMFRDTRNGKLRLAGHDCRRV